MAQIALLRGDDRTKALRETMSELLAMDEPRKRFAAMMSGPRRPLRPRRGAPAARAPHARSRPGHRRRPAAGLHACSTMPGRCCSISVSPAASTSRHGRIGFGWSMRVRRRLGAPGPRRGHRSPAALVRPDGYVAWVGDGPSGARRRAHHLVRTAARRATMTLRTSRFRAV